MTDTSESMHTHNSLVSPFLSHASPFPSYRDRRVSLTGTRGSWRVAASPPICKGCPVVLRSRTAPLMWEEKKIFLRHPNQLLLLTVE